MHLVPRLDGWIHCWELSKELTPISPPLFTAAGFPSRFWGSSRGKQVPERPGMSPAGAVASLQGSIPLLSGPAPLLQPYPSRPGRAVLQGQLVHDLPYHQNLCPFGFSSLPVLLSPVFAARCAWPRRASRGWRRGSSRRQQTAGGSKAVRAQAMLGGES